MRLHLDEVAPKPWESSTSGSLSNSNVGEGRFAGLERPNGPLSGAVRRLWRGDFEVEVQLFCGEEELAG